MNELPLTYDLSYTLFHTTLKGSLTWLEDLERNFQLPEKGLQCTIQGLQLQDVDLPDEFDVEIANTQTQLQESRS